MRKRNTGSFWQMEAGTERLLLVPAEALSPKPLRPRTAFRLALGVLHAGMWATLVANRIVLKRTARRVRPTRRPKLSVIVPARNEEAHLPRLLASLWAQDYPDFEVVVYDDGSSDATPNLLAQDPDPRLVRLRGEGPPPGWVGKCHALYRATRHATGEAFLFLDADVELRHPGALRALAERFAALPAPAILTGFPYYGDSGGLLLVPLVVDSMLIGLPWALVPTVPVRNLAALNGQVWMIRAADYYAHEPHLRHRDEVLEDVEIGRTMKAEGVPPYLAALHRDLSVRMYASTAEAWRGFSKNAYLLFGGTPGRFAATWAFYNASFVVSPLVSPWAMASVVGLKLVADTSAGLSPLLALGAWPSYAAGSAVALASARAFRRGTVTWKGRNVHASHLRGDGLSR